MKVTLFFVIALCCVCYCAGQNNPTNGTSGPTEGSMFNVSYRIPDNGRGSYFFSDNNITSPSLTVAAPAGTRVLVRRVREEGSTSSGSESSTEVDGRPYPTGFRGLSEFYGSLGFVISILSPNTSQIEANFTIPRPRCGPRCEAFFANPVCKLTLLFYNEATLTFDKADAMINSNNNSITVSIDRSRVVLVSCSSFIPPRFPLGAGRDARVLVAGKSNQNITFTRFGSGATELSISGLSASAGYLDVGVVSSNTSANSVSPVFRFEHSAGSTAVTAASLSYNFALANVTVEQARQLAWFTYNAALLRWERVESVLDAANKLINTTTNHFSDWSVQRFTTSSSVGTTSSGTGSSATSLSNFINVLSLHF